jgi:hypothetical protein
MVNQIDWAEGDWVIKPDFWFKYRNSQQATVLWHCHEKWYFTQFSTDSSSN